MVTGLPDTIDFRKVSPRNAADYISAVLLFNGAYIRLYQRIIPQRAVFHPKGAGERPNFPLGEAAQKTVSRIVDAQKVRQGFVERREIGFRECGVATPLVVGEQGRGDAKPNCLGSRGRLIDLLRRLQAGDSVPG